MNYRNSIWLYFPHSTKSERNLREEQMKTLERRTRTHSLHSSAVIADYSIKEQKLSSKLVIATNWFIMNSLSEVIIAQHSVNT